MAYVAGAMVIVLLLVWYFASGRSTRSNDAAKPEAVSTSAVEQNQAVATNAATKPAAGVPVAAANAPSVAVQNASGESRGNWRVIAFTYNREDQAQQKVAEIAQSHPDLNPVVFTPSGHAPFLVQLGGAMSKQEAFAFSGKAKREGMPRDIYAQNYRNRGN